MPDTQPFILCLTRDVPEIGGRAGDFLIWDPRASTQLVLRRELADNGIALNTWMSGAAEPVTPIPPYAARLAAERAGREAPVRLERGPLKLHA